VTHHLAQALRSANLVSTRRLFLAACAGRTAREIGELENAPVGTIKTRIRAAMSKLRDSLETTNEL